MSTIKVTNLRGRNGSPTLPDGAVVTGVATATTFDGSLKSTGTPTLGLGVTINSSGVNVSGVLTATTYYGDGTNLTGVGESIAPHFYNPDVNDPLANVDTGIGITFNKKIEAGSGTATIKLVNAVSGAAGTTVQSWGISSATYNVTQFTLGSLVSNLENNKTYQIDIPSGFIVDSNETSYAGTAYTFATSDVAYALWAWGYGLKGQNAQSTNNTEYSSPVQIPGLSWANLASSGAAGPYHMLATRDDGTLWGWGSNQEGELGLNTRSAWPGSSHVSSPKQVGSDTTWPTTRNSRQLSVSGTYWSAAIKTDGTLWTWGNNGTGSLGQNTTTTVSSPVQVPGTTWSEITQANNNAAAIKTDGTLWTWGRNGYGQLGQNAISSPANHGLSSPVQVGSDTTWRSVNLSESGNAICATKTNGTLWVWGNNDDGALGMNQPQGSCYSSPVQIPGTTWNSNINGAYKMSCCTKTDGTLWAWGGGYYGMTAQNNETIYSSPVQIPGTTWGQNQAQLDVMGERVAAIKTDGTLWVWGRNQQYGPLGQNNNIQYSSPVQIPGTDWSKITGGNLNMYGLIEDTTP